MATLFNLLNAFVDSLGQSSLNNNNNDNKINNNKANEEDNKINENNDNKNYNNDNDDHNIIIEKEEDKNKIIWPENEDDEDKQFQLALKQSEEEAKKILEQEKEEERQLERALKESELENKTGTLNYYSDCNIININQIEEKEEEFDEEYGICPITQEYMKNPVITPSGNYYEKTAIIDWINKEGTEPLTREKLTVDMLIEDKKNKKQIIEYRKKFDK